MKVPRALLGKYVEVVWRDPIGNPKRLPVRKAPRGMSALATWRERGVLDDLTDGVARIVHSHADDPPWEADPEPEIYATWVPEVLIEAITVFEPAKTEKEEA